MRARDTFAHLQKNVAKYPVDINKYVIPQFESKENSEEIEKYSACAQEENANEQKTLVENLAPFQNTPRIVSPRICIWDYMQKFELQALMKLESKRQIRQTIENNLNQEYPKGSGRLLVVELMYSVRKFCDSSEFNLEQSGATLSMFYLTHRYFTSLLQVSAEKVYEYFKEFVMKHSLMVPPKYTKIFTFEEAKNILLFFCKLYLRNLPLIRLLTLPNFALYLDCYIEPEPVFKKDKNKGKEKKGKKDKKGKDKKGKKK